MAAGKLLVAVLLVSSLCCIKSSDAAKSINCECGLPSTESLRMRIVGGSRVVPHALPWMVAIKLELEGGTHLNCGGTVVSDRHVLSAGHCFQKYHYTKLRVLLGLHDVQDLNGVEKRKIVKCVIHENFKSNEYRDDNDIAVATLDCPVVFNIRIRPICLPEPGQDFTGSTATIAGWGGIGEKQKSPNELLQANVNIMSTSECNREPITAKLLTSSMICAYAKGRDSCQGDSGGPMMVVEPSGKYVQVGIISWGVGCADPRYPGVLTKVSLFTNWIKKQIADGTTCTL